MYQRGRGTPCLSNRLIAKTNTDVVSKHVYAVILERMLSYTRMLEVSKYRNYLTETTFERTFYVVIHLCFLEIS